MAETCTPALPSGRFGTSPKGTCGCSGFAIALLGNSGVVPNIAAPLMNRRRSNSAFKPTLLSYCPRDANGCPVFSEAPSMSFTSDCCKSNGKPCASLASGLSNRNEGFLRGHSPLLDRLPAPIQRFHAEHGDAAFVQFRQHGALEAHGETRVKC